MRRDEAEALRRDPRHWHWGIVYCCPQDPRLFVRNNFVIGWTWNFGHRYTFIALVAVVLLFAGSCYVAMTVNAAGGVVLTVFLVYLLGAVAVTHYVASGPR